MVNQSFNVLARVTVFSFHPLADSKIFVNTVLSSIKLLIFELGSVIS